ncbi:MAG: hypothetical protein PHE04_02740 [Bacteroidales bacterium]|nr:hypothetical protein [Bacteroidales bacterium]
MKTKKRLLSVLTFVLIFVAGYALGLVLNFPNIGSEQLTGTIAKLSNYRNTKVNEADIALKNELLNDSTQRNIVSAYLNYYYAKTAAYANSLEFALDQSGTITELAAQEANATTVSSYLKFLQEARKELLMASMQCQAVENTDPAALRNSLNQANNVIARMNQANPVLLDYIDRLDVFLQNQESSAYPLLRQAHDQLVIDQLGGLIISKDKVLMKYFDKKRMYTQLPVEQAIDMKGYIIKDLQKLSASYPNDMEKLGFLDIEKLGVMDKEELGLKETDELAFCLDKEKLGMIIKEVEQLGILLESVVLSAGFTDAEKLEIGFFDFEKLGSIGFFDFEKLGSIGFFNEEKLRGVIALDSEKLGLAGLL